MISILIPIYNGIEFINESVGSVLKQSYPHWEIIIGVNGHSQNSDVYMKAKKMEKVSQKIKVYDLYTIKGKANALNEMIQYCSYDYVAILDVDDIWLPIKLEEQVPFLYKYDVIGTKCVYFGMHDGLVPDIPTGDISHFHFMKANPIINSSSLIRKEYAQWDDNDNLYGVEDYELWLRLRLQNKKFFNVNKVLVMHRLYATSAFNSSNRQTIALHQLKAHYATLM